MREIMHAILANKVKVKFYVTSIDQRLTISQYDW